MRADYHVHTNYSDDSNYLMEDCVKDAIKLGYNEICFTDHVDYGVKKEYIKALDNGKTIMNVDYENYFKEIHKLQMRYRDEISIKVGLEFGVQSHTINQFENLYQKYEYDFIILSIHQVNNKEFWTGEFQKGKSEKEYYTAYFNEMYHVIEKYNHYCVLGHMDLLKRYDNHDNYDIFNNHKDIITKILNKIIKDGKGIELNTSSFKYGLDDLMPSRVMLSLYLELGGRIITIGSDSHSNHDLSHAHIEEMKNELKKIGFKEFCTYSKMKPIYHKL